MKPVPAGIPVKIVLYTILAMIAFAANSILCRYALGGERIDAASFSMIRICSGALILFPIGLAKKRSRQPVVKKRAGWLMPAMLTTYALFFSYAYIDLPAGTGALILFGAVQATMIISGWISGERMDIIRFTGFAMAVSGLVYLVMPGISAPSPSGAAFMVIAGIAWGIYSLIGRKAQDPVSATVSNFIWAAPMVLAAGFLLSGPVRVTGQGITAAIVSGTLASGCGYVIWYAALRGLGAIQASIVQLTVPVIAAAGGILLLSEDFSFRFFIASTVILSGVALSLKRKIR